VLAKEIDSLELYYSNSNTFHFDTDGYLVNSTGSPLLVYDVNTDGSSSSVSISTSQQIKIDYQLGNPMATDQVSVGTNLPSSGGELAINAFNNQDVLTYNSSTSVAVFDSLGETHILTLYFIHVNVANNTWEVRTALDNNVLQPITEQILDFAPNGQMDLNDDDLDGFITMGNGAITEQNFALSNGANDLSITLDFTPNTTSLNNSFEVTSLTSSGFYTDNLKEFKIDTDGLITLTYVHGEDKLMGRVALAKFPSPYNLKALGNSLWAETENSGTAAYGETETENFGAIVPLVYDY